MSIYKKSIKMSLGVTVLSFFVSLIMVSNSNKYGIWIENICVGIFASGLLMLFSSGIGYFMEEEKTLREYCWRIKELKDKVLNLQTLSGTARTTDDYFQAVLNINSLLRSYFAVVDIDFFFRKRRKIQKIYEIHSKLEPFNRESSNAALYMGQYRTQNIAENGKRTYPQEKYIEDIRDFCNMIDNFQDTGEPLVIWLHHKEEEYSKLIFSNK